LSDMIKSLNLDEKEPIRQYMLELLQNHDDKGVGNGKWKYRR